MAKTSSNMFPLDFAKDAIYFCIGVAFVAVDNSLGTSWAEFSPLLRLLLTQSVEHDNFHPDHIALRTAF